MANISSRLLFDYDNLDFTLDSETPDDIYRYFDTESDRASFLSGNIRFSGPSKLRFFMNPPALPFDEERRGPDNNDPYEYRNDYSTALFKYSLSFSRIHLLPHKPNIVLRNIRGFLEEIISAIKNSSLDHEVSWLPMTELRKNISIVPAISTIKSYPTKDGEEVQLYVTGLEGKILSYENKIIKSESINSIPSPGAIDLMKNALSQNAKFKRENEYRICLNSGDFIGKYTNLLHLVEYLKIKCPNIHKYCEVVPR